jgi:endo-1,4-beta-xylanase
MSTFRRALLRACLFAAVPIATFAQTNPVIIEAESGVVDPAFYTSGTLDGANYITITQDSPAFGPPTAAGGAVIYTVNFPAAGNYELYARFRVGAGGGSDDSFFIGNGFGDKFATNGPWSNANQIDNGGYTIPADTVRNGGFATTLQFKWFKLSGFAGPAIWTVPDGQLTQQFSFAGRETGNFVDKFAFGRAGSFYTVNDLNTGGPATGSPPPPDPPPYTRTGAPLATGKAKFLGSAHSGGNSLNFNAYWNQVTPENGGKWASAQPTSPFGPAPDYVPLANPAFNWTEARNAYNAAQQTGGNFRWHVLFWGNQQPGWIETLPTNKQLEAIHIWLAAIAREFPDLRAVEVVNEPLHDPPRGPGNGNYIEALGGNGTTGWDWIINGFTLARQYFPNAKLMLNDFSITNAFQAVDHPENATTNYLTIINLLKDRGLIDIVGVQGHAFEYNYNNLANTVATHRFNLERLAQAGFPIFVTEFDIDGSDDPVQLARYQAIFPAFWESPHVQGITMWGYTRNGHWRRAAGDWLMYENGAERPALQWLVRYVENNLAVVTPNQSFTIAENAAAGSAIGTVVATDTETDAPLSQWQITDASGKFVIDASSGALSLAPGATLDFEAAASYVVSVSVYDGYSRSAPENVTINLTNLNDNPPVITAGQSYRIDGGRNNTVAKVLATDADDTNQPGFTTFSGWAITSGNTNNVFRFNGTGDLQVGRPLLVDWRKTSYSLGSRVSDGANNSAVQTVQVTIPNRVNLCLLNAIRLEAPKAAAPLLILLGADLGSCR